MTRQKAQELMEAIKILRNGATDEIAISAVSIYPEWKVEADLQKDERIQYDGKLYRVLQAHTSQETWTPVSAPSLFAEILPGQGGTEVGEWVQPNSTNPYMKGDRVIHNSKTWESIIDNNVWEPGVYGWNEVS